jgi:hypothetical protein
MVGRHLGVARAGLGAALILATLTGPERVQAEGPNASPTREQCVEAHRQHQQLRQSNRLIEARAVLDSCANSNCPGPILNDCAQWLSRMEAAVPSIVVDVRANDDSAPEAMVTIDGQRINAWASGEPIELNPGRHVVRVELPPFEPIEKTIVLAEGMRFRMVAVEFAKPKPDPSAPAGATAETPVATERPVPFLVYPLLGASVLGLGGFIGLGSAGKAEQKNLRESCAPRCSPDDEKGMKTLFLAADISLAVGAASAVAAGVLFIKRPTVSVAAGPVGGTGFGAAVSLTTF